VIDVHFIFLGAAIGAVGQSIYIRDTVRGVTQPNRVTFLLWAAAPLLAFAVEINQGVGLTSLMTFMVGAGPLAIFGASFVNRNAVWRIGRLEYVCASVSVLGTLGWLVTRHGAVAIVASIAADLLAGIPTISKSWTHPETETAWLYIGGFLFAVITLLTVHEATLAAVAFPAYIALIGALQITLVAGRVGVRHRWRGQPASHKMGS
jgi:hypothetical protein